MFNKIKICKKVSIKNEGKTYFCICAEDKDGKDVLISFVDYNTLMGLSNRLGIFLNKEIDLDKPFYLN